MFVLSAASSGSLILSGMTNFSAYGMRFEVRPQALFSCKSSVRKGSITQAGSKMRITEARLLGSEKGEARTQKERGDVIR